MIFIIYTSCHSPSYNGYKLNSHLTCFQRGFKAQLVEHSTSIAELMGSNPIEASDFFLGFVYNCLSCFTTATITFTYILFIHSALIWSLSYTHHVRTGVLEMVQSRNFQISKNRMSLLVLSGLLSLHVPEICRTLAPECTASLARKISLSLSDCTHSRTFSGKGTRVPCQEKTQKWGCFKE